MKKKFRTICLFVSISLVFACKSDEEKKKVKKSEPNTETSISGRFEVDENSSLLNWIGSKPTGNHNGTIKIESGEMLFENGALVSGKFTIAMESINVKDLVGQDKIDLENHLKGTVAGKEDHFFNVNKFPKAYFKIKSVEPFEDRYKIKGDLEIKGIKNSIEFISNINFGKEKKAVKLISNQFTIDRTKWGIEFMSKSAFDDLKNKFIKDDIELKIYLKASKL